MSDAAPIGYNVHSPDDREKMLEEIGVASVEELLEPVPSSVRLQRPLDLPPPLSEWELSRKMLDLASRNETSETFSSWLGGRSLPALHPRGGAGHRQPGGVPDLLHPLPARR